MKLINLSLGDPCYGPPTKACQAALKLCLPTAPYMPPAGYLPLRVALSRKLQRINEIAAIPEQVVVTTGAAAGLYASVSVTCSPEDTLLIPDPAFPLYETLAFHQRLKLKRYPLRPLRNYEPDWDALRELARHASAMIWNFPLNPVGTVARPEWFERLGSLLSANPQLHLISDEVYDEIIFSGKHLSPAALLKDSTERIISVFSFSKTYGMTGWRIGYLHAAKTLSDRISRAHWAATMSTSTISQFAALAALGNGAQYRHRITRFLKTNRNIVMAALAQCGFKPVEPEAGMYVWVDVSECGIDCSSFAQRCQQEACVTISPGVMFGPEFDDYIRVFFAVDRVVLRTALRRIHNWMRHVLESELNPCINCAERGGLKTENL